MSDESIRETTNRVVSLLTAMFDTEISAQTDLADRLLDELASLDRERIFATCVAALEMIRSLLEMWADVECEREVGRPATEIEKARWALDRIREQAVGIAGELNGPEVPARRVKAHGRRETGRLAENPSSPNGIRTRVPTLRG